MRSTFSEQLHTPATLPVSPDAMTRTRQQSPIRTRSKEVVSKTSGNEAVTFVNGEEMPY